MQEPIDSQPEVLNITKKMTTGEVTEKYPATKEVFSKHFGKSCFDCPAFGTEDINLACMMHNTDVEMFVNELIEAARKGINPDS
jgi:hybrid cluster-associated redox disulfide protein